MLAKSELSTLIGKPFIPEKDGYAWGCLAPLYEIIPETMIFRYPVSEDKNMLQYFKTYFKELSEKDALEYGDILILRLPKSQWHLMVCVGEGKAIHCTGHIDTEIVLISKYEKWLKGVFRWARE